MNYKEYLDIKPEVAEALAAGKPVVALESTILSHGMPYQQNLDFAAKVEEVVRSEGAVPATMALIDGRIKVGLSEADLDAVLDPKLYIGRCPEQVTALLDKIRPLLQGADRSRAEIGL